MELKTPFGIYPKELIKDEHKDLPIDYFNIVCNREILVVGKGLESPPRSCYINDGTSNVPTIECCVI